MVVIPVLGGRDRTVDLTGSQSSQSMNSRFSEKPCHKNKVDRSWKGGSVVK